MVRNTLSWFWGSPAIEVDTTGRGEPVAGWAPTEPEPAEQNTILESNPETTKPAVGGKRRLFDDDLLKGINQG